MTKPGARDDWRGPRAALDVPGVAPRASLPPAWSAVRRAPSPRNNGVSVWGGGQTVLDGLIVHVKERQEAPAGALKSGLPPSPKGKTRQVRGEGARGAARLLRGEGSSVQTAARVRRGFTLMELSLGLLLAALMASAAVPAFRAITASRLKRSAGQISGMAQEAYARAAISGKPHRMVMNLDENTFWLEMGSGSFGLQMEKAKQLTEVELNEQQNARKTGTYKLPVKESDLSEAERLKKQLLAGPSWTAVDDDLGHPIKLPPDCGFEKVWVAHQAEGFVRGTALLYFWPTGRSETAIIRLTDDPEGRSRIISIKVNGLTGRSIIANKALEIPTS